MTNYTQWKSLVDLHEYSAIPDAVESQWLSTGFADPWPAEISDIDIIHSGQFSQTTIDNVDAVDTNGERGTASGPEQLLKQEQFAVAYTVAYDSGGDFNYHNGFRDDDGTGARFGTDGNQGGLRCEIRDDSGNTIDLRTGDNGYDDGLLRLVIWSKSGDSESETDLYVGSTESDMEDAVSVSDSGDGASFDHEDVSLDIDYGVGGPEGTGSNISHETTFYEFWFGGVPDESERKAMIDRVPALG